MTGIKMYENEEKELQDLVDINDVKINMDLPMDERIKDYVRQIGNPYCYKDHDMTIKISFAGKTTLEEALCKVIDFGFDQMEENISL